MSDRTKLLMQKIRVLDLELDAELARRRAGLCFGIERGRVLFDEEVRRRHLELKTRLLTYMRTARPLVVLTAPLIYGLLVPIVVLDVAVMVYQGLCFRAYGIERVRRRDYFVFDRHHLAYLNALEKLNCGYCSYANGAIAFIREVAGCTEQHWCPIKHAQRVIGEHEQYQNSADFGDADAYRLGSSGGRTDLADSKM